MKQLLKAGRLFYGAGIIAFGIQQIVTKEFRPEILSPFPVWAHTYAVFSVVAGIALIFAGFIISGVLKIKRINTKNVCLYLGVCLLILCVTSQLPYTLFVSPDKISKWEVWIDPLQALACCGGAFVMAGSFLQEKFNGNNRQSSELMVEKLIPFGRIFFSALMILFGCSHFIITDFVSAMVPKFIGIPLFWTYFAGAALICSGIAIIFKIFIKAAAFLLAIMLFLFFLFVHIPLAIANPYGSGENEVVRAFEALLFCGTALVISITNSNRKIKLAG